MWVIGLAVETFHLWICISFGIALLCIIKDLRNYLNLLMENGSLVSAIYFLGTQMGGLKGSTSANWKYRKILDVELEDEINPFLLRWSLVLVFYHQQQKLLR